MPTNQAATKNTPDSPAPASPEPRPESRPEPPRNGAESGAHIAATFDSAAGAEDAGDFMNPPPPTGPHEDVWEASFIGAAKVGHTLTRIEPIEQDGESLVRTTSRQRLRLARSGDVADQLLLLESLERPNGEVLSLSSQLGSGDAAIHTKAVVRGDRLLVTQEAGGANEELELPWQPGTLGFFGLQQSLERKPLEKGEKRQLRLFMPAINVAAETTLKADEELSKVPLLDGDGLLLKIQMEIKVAGATLRQVMWCDERGHVIKSFDPQVQLLTYRTSRQIATSEATGVFEFDDMVIVPATGKPLANPHDKTQAVYRVSLLDEDPSRVFPSSVGQTVTAIDRTTAEIRIDRRPLPTVSTESAGEKDLAGSALIQTEDLRIQEMAASVAAQDRDPLQIALALEQLVHRSVQRKDYTRAFDSAADVARKLQGDCTEHAVLLTALCRARGIPARVASGLVAYQDKFAYHMWTEVWTETQWTPLDATLGRGRIGAGHIKLVDSNLSNANSLAALLPVLRVLGRLKIEVVSLAD
ncbi:MAG: transglutaminase domain-containing protein [Planctomycetales bacterium]|nr:transglutaminase domain-containing protein [Planctomycetales bacterium]